jgi:hypothetical protein
MMSEETRTARRYHWLSASLESFVNEPHETVRTCGPSNQCWLVASLRDATFCCDARGDTLNLIADEHAPLRDASVELATGAPDRVMDVVKRYVHSGPALSERSESKGPRAPKQGMTSPRLPFDEALPTLDMPKRHALLLQDIDRRHLNTVLLSTYDRAPKDFETLLGLEGVGAHPSRPGARVGGDLRNASQHAGSGAVCGGSRDVRPNDRHAVSRDAARESGSV